MRIIVAIAIVLTAVVSASAQQPTGWATYIGTGLLPFLDPFYIYPYSGAGFDAPNTGTGSYTSASCSRASGTNKIVVVFGQSLFSNTANDTYTVTNPTKVLNFNIFDGKCYQAKYSLLGAGGGGNGSALARMGDNLINNDGVAQVIIVPAMVDATFISLWSSPTTLPYLYNNIATVARRMAANSVVPTEIVWEQGESDCALGTSQGNYAAGLTAVIAAIRSVWPAPIPLIINSGESFQSNTTCSAITAAQAAAINNSASIFAGANTDSLGAGDRYDGTHLNSTGAPAAASLLEAVIVAH